MKVYDTANKLAQEIKESEEYITYKTAKEAINLNYELKKKIDEFEKARYEAQIIALQTGRDNEEKMKNVQEKEKKRKPLGRKKKRLIMIIAAGTLLVSAHLY